MHKQIAFTMQNQREITAHAGKCRRFLIASIGDDGVEAMRWVELSREQVLCGGHLPDDLSEIDVLVTAGANNRLVDRLDAHGIHVVQTRESLPATVLAQFMRGELQNVDALHQRHDCCCQRAAHKHEEE
jgi:predicted Fe-Mo cluster-binding NifX family protein